MTCGGDPPKGEQGESRGGISVQKPKCREEAKEREKKKGLMSALNNKGGATSAAMTVGEGTQAGEAEHLTLDAVEASVLKARVDPPKRKKGEAEESVGHGTVPTSILNGTNRAARGSQKGGRKDRLKKKGGGSKGGNFYAGDGGRRDRDGLLLVRNYTVCAENRLPHLRVR